MKKSHTIDTAFRSQMYKLLIPLVVQNLLNAAVSSSDVIMLNYVGQSSISAVSLASNFASVLASVFYGLGTGATLLCAQYYGKRDFRAIQAVQGIALRFSTIIAAVFAALAFTVPKRLMLLFTSDEELITIGAGYLRVMGITYLCWGIIEIYMATLRSIGRVGIGLALNVMTFFLNIGLNAVFIFGLFGAPKLGATGVGIATAASRVIELIGCVIVSVCSRDVKLKLSEMFRRNRVLTGDFIRLALPALGNDVSWGVAFSMYSVILGHLGNDAVAANSIVVVVRNLGTTFCFAVASAGGILLGNVMGTGDLEKAKRYTSEVIRMTVISGVIGGLILIATIPLVLRLCKPVGYGYGLSESDAVDQFVLHHGQRREYDTHCRSVPCRRRYEIRPCLRYHRYVVLWSSPWVYCRIRAGSSGSLGVFPALHGRIREVALGHSPLPQRQMGKKHNPG